MPPIPFLWTRPTSDIILLFALLPVWWVLGVEQFVWLPMTAMLFAKVVMGVSPHRHRIVIVRPARWLIVFLGTQLLSGLFIVESFRVITFLRNFSMYVSVTLLLIVMTNIIQTKQQLMKIIWALMFMAGCATLLGVLGILDLFVPKFVAPVAKVLPSVIKNTGYGMRVIVKSSGQVGWFTVLRNFFRVRTYFMYATMYAAALVLLIPLEIFAFKTAARTPLGKALMVILIVLSLINLVFTTGRGAMLGLVVGAGVFLLTARTISTRTRLSSLFLLGIGGVTFSLIVILATGDVMSRFQEFIEAVLHARGGGSYQNRMFVYRMTLDSWQNRPVFGWGTQRDIPHFPLYPMGSHSQYLGILYKQGITGLIVYGVILCSVWRSSRVPPRLLKSADPYLLEFIDFARWSFVANCVNGLTDVMDLDAVVIHVLWVIISLLLSARRMVQGNPVCSEEPGDS